ncbi:MAG: GspE/PulE family protein, partial [Bacteroidetes bacterium]|nr:GspE/PulE family protein [Bacteroidota bacterium]
INQPPLRPGGMSTIPVQRIPLEQFDVKNLSREKIRELFRLGRLPTAEQIAEEILIRAVLSGASDVHIEPIEGELQIRFAIEGVLRRIVSLPPDMNEPILSIFKTKAALNQFEKKKPQEGRFSGVYNSEGYDFRINTIPVLAGERGLIRVLRKAIGIAKLDELGFSTESYERIVHLLRSPRGLFLITGPSGSGKTTTVYALVNQLNTPEKCIITVEDPVEYRLPFASQVHLPPDKSFNFIDALRAILRQNPNVIMIGEIRDAETGVVAAEAALTGNLVLSTMLADDSIGAIHRLFNLGVPAYWLASTMVGVVFQVLMRKICEHCKEEYALTAEDLEFLDAPVDLPALRLFRGRGCQACGGTGYSGRMPVCEVVTITPSLRDLIFQKASILKMREEAMKSGYQGIRQDAIRRVIAGTTTVHELVRVLG